VNAEETIIYIKADGSIIPHEAAISTVDNTTYMFTGDIVSSSVVIERNGVTLDGTGHTITGTGISGKPGINITRVDNVTIKRVRIRNASPAIWLRECSNCTLLENEIPDNIYGIYANFCKRSAILRNTVMNNQGGGIYVANSLNLSIQQNLVVAKLHPFGIGLQASTNMTITENVIANNEGFGIRILFSNNVRLFHNNFVNNTNNAFSQASTNIWDNGNEGNWWSDFNGVDMNQDGIGDTPYMIDASNVDRYPLVQPLRLGLSGDVNYDGIVDISDLTLLGSVYGKREGESGWVPQADLARPYGIINMLDVVTCVAHYKETYP
jgi:parallel beta-helix repeat protein